MRLRRFISSVLAFALMFLPFAPARATSSVIQSIHAYTLTIAASSTSATQTISAVVTANTMLVYNGETTTGVSFQQSDTRITLTNSTTVTATRGNSTNAVTVHFTVVEFASGVNSIQYGTITINSGSGSNTGSISAVGANAFVLWLGASTTNSGTNYNDDIGGVQLTNSTTVTATTDSLVTLIVGYVVIDLDTSIVSAVQQRSVANGTTNASYTDTITSVDPTKALLMFDGFSSTATSIGVTNSALTMELTNATTVTLTRVGTNTNTRTFYYTVVTFASGALNGSVQRGTIAQAAETSHTATITSVNTGYSFVNWGNFRTAAGNPNVVQPALNLTDNVTVTALTDSAGSPTTAFEVIQFAGGGKLNGTMQSLTGAGR